MFCAFCQCIFPVSLSFLRSLLIFFQKTLDFFDSMCYNKKVGGKRLSGSPIRRCIEVVITRTTRNRLGGKTSRGFESHHLRHFRGISAAGSAPHWQCGGHGFESRMLHTRLISKTMYLHCFRDSFFVCFPFCSLFVRYFEICASKPESVSRTEEMAFAAFALALSSI